MKIREEALNYGLTFPNTYMGKCPFHESQLAAGTCEGQ